MQYLPIRLVMRMIIMLSALFLTSCAKEGGNLFDLTEVSFIVLNSSGENVFDPERDGQLCFADLKLYRLNEFGERLLVETDSQTDRGLRVVDNDGTYCLIVPLDLESLGDYSYNILQIGSSREVSIRARMKLELPLFTIMGGALRYDELIIDGQKVKGGDNYSPIQLTL